MANEVSQLDAALLDVRKAFRLLYQYNQRARDLAEVIASSIGWAPFQTFGLTPISGKRSVRGSWSTWDCTPTNDWSFLYPSPESKSIRARCLGVWLYADSGFFESSDDDPAKFPPPELCRSSVYLAFFQARRFKAPSWLRIWEDSGAFDDGKGMSVVVINEGSPDEVRFVWKEFPFTSFQDEFSATETVKEFMHEASVLLDGEL